MAEILEAGHLYFFYRPRVQQDEAHGLRDVIGATDDPERELGIDLRPRDERETQAAIFRDLKLERDQHPLEPLFRGEWR